MFMVVATHYLIQAINNHPKDGMKIHSLSEVYDVKVLTALDKRNSTMTSMHWSCLHNTNTITKQNINHHSMMIVE